MFSFLKNSKRKNPSDSSKVLTKEEQRILMTTLNDVMNKQKDIIHHVLEEKVNDLKHSTKTD